MFENFEFIVFPLFVACFISLMLTPFGIIIAKKLKLVDDPSIHKHPAIIHKKPIPRAGGLSIYFAIAFSSLLLFGFNNHILNLILLSGALVVLIGILDDKYDLSPYLRFGFNIFSALILVFGGLSVPYITNPLGGILHFDPYVFRFADFNFGLPLSEIIAVVWIVWVMNMLNWSKGVDGQMPGIAAIAAFIIGIASLRFFPSDSGNIFTAQMSFIVAGAAIGFLYYNFYPARIFPGYSSTILGFLIGVLSIISSAKLATALLVMGIPMADALFTIVRRLYAKKSPFWHDKGHLHHLLLGFGFSQRTIAIFYWSMTLILGIIALQLSSKGKLFAIISVIIVVSAVILTLKYLSKKGILND